MICPQNIKIYSLDRKFRTHLGMLIFCKVQLYFQLKTLWKAYVYFKTSFKNNKLIKIDSPKQVPILREWNVKIENCALNCDNAKQHGKNCSLH